MVLKDISWLWRTAYNCAVQGCSDWSDAEERAPRLFDVAREVWNSLTHVLCHGTNVSVKASRRHTVKRHSLMSMKNYLCVLLSHLLPLFRAEVIVFGL